MNEKWTKSSLPLLLLCLILALALWACSPTSSKPDISGEEEAADEAEAERTRKMEEKAAEIERMAEEIRTMEGSEQDKIDAVARLEEARRELAEMEEEGDEP
jgi:TolA-binding protein